MCKRCEVESRKRAKLGMANSGDMWVRLRMAYPERIDLIREFRRLGRAG